MVTLVQHQQTADDGNLYQKEQERAIALVSQSVPPHESSHCRTKFEQLNKPTKDTVIFVPHSNGSIGDTSTQCSDIEDENETGVNGDEGSEEEEEEEEDDDENSNVDEEEWKTDLPVAAIIQHHHQQVVTENGNVVLPNVDPSTFGDVCIKNSTNVHLGNKTFYKGPVSIKQFIYTNPTSVQEHETTHCDVGRTSDANASNLSNKADGSLNRPILTQHSEIDKEWLNVTQDRFNPYEQQINANAEEENRKESQYPVTKWLWTWRCAAVLCTLAFVTMIVMGSIFLTHKYDAPAAPVFPEIPDSSVEGVIVGNVRFVQRSEWGAQPPTEPLTKMKLPVPYVIISHTATEFCTTQSECVFHVRFAQTFHIESRKWADIAYNFLVGGDGLAYVGRSWDYMGAHAFGYNNRSIGISFIGTFNTIKPPKAQLHAAQKIIELGVEAGKIAKDYKLLGHRQVSKTLSPGDALYEIIKTWPHWSPWP